jgi:hypothetical protein
MFWWMEQPTTILQVLAFQIVGYFFVQASRAL